MTASRLMAKKFYDKNMFERKKKTFRHSKKDNKIQELPPFGKFVTEVLIFKAAVHRCFSK